MEQIREFKRCNRCKWVWFPRDENPRICPKCKSRYWNQEQKPKRGPKR